jgi:hypothetical protein
MAFRVDIPAEKRLVFWGDKLYTELFQKCAGDFQSPYHNGTVLERIDLDDRIRL